MFQGLEATEKAAKIGLSLDQHCRELGAIEEKLKRPDLEPEKAARLLSRVPVVRKKIGQLCGSLQAG